MPRALVVPGVSVSTRYEVSPPSVAARSGVLGAVGVVDRDPGDGPLGVTTSQELLEIFGPATRYSFPEAMGAMANGISEVIVSPVKGGQSASVFLLDDEGEKVATLRARAAGPWGNDLAVEVLPIVGADGMTVRRISLNVLYKGKVIERHNNLIFKAGDDSDFFETINNNSSAIVAVDPVFETDLPQPDGDYIELPTAGARKAAGALTKNGTAVVNLQAKATGKAGNGFTFQVLEGRASLVLKDAGDNDSIYILAEEQGDDGSDIQIIVNENLGKTDVDVIGKTGDIRNYHGYTDVGELVDDLNADPDVIVEKRGDVPPAPTGATIDLKPSRTIVMRIKGVSTKYFNDLVTAQDIVDVFAPSDSVEAALVGGADELIDATEDNAFPLTGGRDAGRAKTYNGKNNPSDEILEIIPVDPQQTSLRIKMAGGTDSGTVRLLIGLDNDGNFVQKEIFDNLVMDPDSLNYLPKILKNSEYVRGVDLYKPSGAVDFPSATSDPVSFINGAAPATSKYKDSIDALGSEDAVDLILSGLQEWKDANLDGVAVQQHMLGHCRVAADNAKPRIALGSIKPVDSSNHKKIIDHAGQVAGRRFALVSPAGAEGALAGLLGHLEFFQSPTFKTVASPGVALNRYSDSQLNKLVGPQGNVCVIAQKRGRGTICIKGISTSGDQISVTRIADNCVRRVKAISDKFIGELNNADSRNALKQMIVATFIQMEKDGSLVPSVDGSSPAFQVDVYASQTDSAAGIVRIDIAVRPVRAIDYIYATITVKN